ncbi:hypothetical protein PFICI_07425 [Pestalotiopsis fici W106-1]|uniref:Uncharacterized protein n=1 Tax=Pestalotiopsis fici (strain W106-1 / CGMCC3.15140) TaxID=1229662 RepID=W3X400_PESFW|nr:uncharacterized protein PFICI_07425 [Pestalotiopsis fici W106-1]ETS79896.1 hypothetical protein PFICI_07425 [Pestalotiopsis fici W106-1]
MASLRITNALRAVSGAACYRAPAAASYRTFTSTSRCLADQGYGDGKGSPQGENPSKQPGASQAQHASEHPGPSPPDVGKGTGGGPTKAALNKSMNKAAESQKDPADASAASGGSRSKEAQEKGSSPTGGSVGGGGEALKGPQGEGAPRPKIHNQSVPSAKQGLSEEQKREVEEHNKDFEKRHDRAAPAGEDKVDKNYWKGE